MPSDNDTTGTDSHASSNWEIVQPEREHRQPRQSGCCGCCGCLLALVALVVAFFALSGMGIAAIGAVFGLPEILVILLAGLALWGGVRILLRVLS